MCTGTKPNVLTYKSSSSIEIDSCFSMSYDNARLKFFDSLTDDWIIKRYNDDETTVAVLKNSNSNDWIIHTSGLHGVEGYTGSAIQTNILKETEALCRDNNMPNIMLVHSMNPYGMKTMQRTNRNNVDLNRNSIINNDFHSDSEVFKDKYLRNFINPESILWYVMLPVLLIYSLIIYGIKFTTQSVVTGQYSNAVAMSYGGSEHQSEIKDFYKEIGKFLSSESRVYHIDVHTGYGKYMNEYLMVNTMKDMNNVGGIFRRSNFYVNSESPEYENMKGGLIQGFEHLLLEYGNVSIQSYHGIVQEFGTVNYVGIPIFLSLRSSNFWRHYHKKDYCIYANIRKNMFNLFNPQNAEYKKISLDLGMTRMYELINHLRTVH